MHYLYLLIACLFFALQFIFQKFYQRRALSTIRVCLWCQFFSSTAVVIWMAVTSGIPTSVSLPALILALLCALATLVCSACTIFAMARGPVGVVSFFCLIGSMIIPFFYGVFFLSEQASIAKWIGIAVLTVSVMLPMLIDRGKKGEKKAGATYYLLCIVIFLANGFANVFSKMHQICPEPMTASGFVLLGALLRILIAALLLLGMAVHLKKRGEQNVLRTVFVEVGKQPMTGKLFVLLVTFSAAYSICNALGNVFSLKCMNVMDASMQFPILSAIVIVMSSILGRIFFKERITRGVALSLVATGVGVLLFIL